MGLLDYTGKEYEPPKASVAGYTGTGYETGEQPYKTYQSTDTSAEGYKADQRDVSPDSLVQNRITGLLKEDSPYLEQFRTAAKQRGNQRGLLNTSMTVGAGEAAAAAGALPIAQQDAGVYDVQNRTNQAAQNQALQFGATERNRARDLNAQLRTGASEFGATAANVAAGKTFDARNRASEFGAAAENQADQFTAGEINRAELQSADFLNSLISAQQSGELQNWLAEMNDTRQKGIMVLEADLREKLAGVDQKYAVELETLKSNYSLLENMNTQSGTLYADTLKSLSNILATTDLTPEQQQLAVQTEIELLQGGLEFLNGLSVNPS